MNGQPYDGGLTAMSRLVGSPAAAAAKMILNGKPMNPHALSNHPFSCTDNYDKNIAYLYLIVFACKGIIVLLLIIPLILVVCY